MLSQVGTTLSLESIDKFRSSLLGKGRSEDTVKAYSTDLRVMLMELEEDSIPPEEFAETAERWLTANRRRVAAKTTGRRLTSLRAFARWAGYGEILSDYSAPQPLRPQPHPLPEGIDGVFRLIEAARNEKQRALVSLCGLCGLRVSEALKVKPSHFDLIEMTLHVYGKGDKERTVPVSERAWEVLAGPVTRAFCDGDRLVVGLQDRFARRVITELGKRAQLRRPIASHDLRASFATELANRGVHLRVIQELLGHASSKTTEIYTEVKMTQMRTAVQF
jgi:site-specific recombinase XerD